MDKKVALGAFLIVVGLLLLLDNLHLLILPYWFYSWQVLLIGIGVFNLALGNRAPGVILIGVGSVFLAREFYYFNMRDFWPVILIIIGISFLLRNRAKSPKPTEQSTDLSDYFDILNFFGGGNKFINSNNLMGGKVTSVFGGGDLDLREANLDGKAHIEMVSVFGGCTIIVPSDWDVKVEVTSVFGGFDDNRRNLKPTSASAQLTIRGVCVFGGGELRS